MPQPSAAPGLCEAVSGRRAAVQVGSDGVFSMLLTKCAACAAELGLTSGKKCGRCSTRYCGPACQKKHWKEGGHDKLCKQIKRGGGAEQYHANSMYAEAVAVAVAKCAEDTKGQTCYICTQALHLEDEGGPRAWMRVEIVTASGTTGVAHVACLAEQAKILCRGGRGEQFGLGSVQ